MIYYIKEGQHSIFRKVRILRNDCYIPKITSNTKRTEKIIKNIKKKNINKIILSKETKQKQEFIKIANNYDIKILDGKWLIQFVLQDIINWLVQNNKISEIDEITILVNDLNENVKENIRRFASSYKKIRIVTNHAERFHKIEEELYEKNGISIIVTNNKRKALVNAKLIINFDFVQEVINQYNINEKAIIINVNDKVKINKKRFSGIIITDYEIELLNTGEEALQELNDILEKSEMYSYKEILEEKIYAQTQKVLRANAFETVKSLLENYNVRIKELYGINGKVR